MTNILILCTGNSCRSQITHGILNHLTADDVTLFSAGVAPHNIHPKAIATLAEIGIDISHHTSNHLEEYKDIPFDYVITVCDHAHESCPVYLTSSATYIHQNFEDPSKLKGTEEEVKMAFSKTREQLMAFCKGFITNYLTA